MTASVLVARLDSDGDVLLAGPAVRAVAARARVTLLCSPRGEQAARLLPGVEQVRVWTAPWIDPDARPVERGDIESLTDDIAAESYDEAIVLTSFHQSALPLALVLRMAGVPVIAGISGDFPGSLLDHRHHFDGGHHEVERNLSLVGRLGYELPAGDDGALRVRRAAEAPRIALTSPYVVVHPGASVQARTWPARNHRELVRALSEAGWSVLVTGGPSERTLARYVCGGDRPPPGVSDLAGRTTLGQLAQVLSRASAVVVGNTGPAHLAAAVGAPIVSLFAATIPAAWFGPWRVAHELLGHAVPCAGCRARTCPVPTHPCMTHIGVEQAFAAVVRLAGAMRDRPPVALRP
jgi:ADP-heptose:LPS heptosyltransferase